jgi:metal-responsive CopG/Arc/MetJ family transcriptional regulator
VVTIGKTSSAVHNKYRAKAYKQFNLALKKDLSAAWEERLKQDGKTRSGWIKEKIDEYLNENKRNGE